MNNPTKDTKVWEWYVETYPTDELGIEIHKAVRFSDVFEALDNYRCVYELLTVYDSVVRERVFEGLVIVTGHTYREIYDKWLSAVNK